jgi:uncharacterized RDD family membrane protein YckC
MPIEISCTGCGRTLRVADDAAGKQARCPACGMVSRIPAVSAAGAAPSFSSSAAPGGFPPPKPAPMENPFADPLAKPSPFGPQGVNPFGGPKGGPRDPGNPYQAPAAFGYTAPRSYHDRLASRGRRFLGALVDSLFLMLGAAPGFVLMIATADSNEEMSTLGLVLLFGGMLVVGIINWVMIANSGQSIAKRLLGMQIIKIDTGELPGFLHGVVLRSWVPAAINQVCNLFSLIDALWIFGEERRCLHDLIAQTIVIDV